MIEREGFLIALRLKLNKNSLENNNIYQNKCEYQIKTDQLVFHAYFKDKSISKEISNNDLQMSIDDFSEIILVPLLIELGGPDLKFIMEDQT